MPAFPASPQMALALTEARAASARGEVPIGAVVSGPDGTILAAAGNRTLELRDPTAHAELLAIRAACAALGSERLPGCTLHVTLEPCPMCASAISQARIATLVYGASDPKSGGVEQGPRMFTHPQSHHVPEVIAGISATESAELLKDFFKSLRREGVSDPFTPICRGAACAVERQADGMTTLSTERDGPILWIRLDRPDAMNAYNAEMGAELTAAFRRAGSDDAIRVVVLTARGRVFCAGADVSAGAGAFDTKAGDGAGNFGSGQDSDFVAAMMDCTKPSIVAFNGSAAGVGLTMALPCDIRIAADTAKFGFVFARRGLVPEAGSAWFLPRLVGMAQALQWCLTGRLFPASEALAKGLVSETWPVAELESRARSLALDIAENCAPVSLALTRRMLWHFGSEASPAGALGIDARLNIALGQCPDVHEGVAAFLGKRPPNFPGRVSTDLPATPWWEAPHTR